MDDAELVAAASEGDRHAYAAIYDRYADRIHDFCTSILRNRADAADAVQETFLVAFETLDGLAQPARLGPWLFALAYRAVLDRIAPDVTAFAGDAASDLPWGSGAPDERPTRAELAEFVWQASAGLGVRERALLDLHLRQGLEGPDLASAAGVRAPLVESRVQRLEAQAERALGALLVAWMYRRSCPELWAVLDRWDGQLTPEFRDRVTAHVDDCEKCNSQRRIAPSPLGLLAAVPVVPAPAYLRSVVLGKAEMEQVEREDNVAAGRMSASAGWVFDHEGFPDLGAEPRRRVQRIEALPPPGSAPTTVMAGAGSGVGAAAAATGVPAGAGGAAGAGGGASAGAGSQAGGGADVPPTAYLPVIDTPVPPQDDRDLRGVLVGGLAGLIILIAAVVILLSNRSRGTSGTIGVGLTTTTSSAPVTSQMSATTAPITTGSTTPTSPPTSLLVPAGHLFAGATKPLDLGATASSATLMVGNDGQAPLDFTASASGSGLSVNPIAGTLGPRAIQALAVSLDRTSAPQGQFTGSIVISSSGGSATFTVNAVIDAGPTISGEAVSPCGVAPSPTTTVTPITYKVTATVTAPLPLKVVVLHFQTSAGGSTSTMTAAGTTYSATMGPFSPATSVEWWISAIDEANATTTSSHHTVPTTFC